MINSYNSSAQTVESGGLISFDTNRIQTGYGVIHVEGSTTFKLNRPGFYYVNFNGIVSSTDTGDLTIQLRNNGELVPGAVSMAYISSDTDIDTMSFSTLIRVPPSCCAVNNNVALSVAVSGIETTVTAPNIVIMKVAQGGCGC